MITEIIEFAGVNGHLVPICISARNSRLHGDGCFDLLDKLEFGERMVIIILLWVGRYFIYAYTSVSYQAHHHPGPCTGTPSRTVHRRMYDR